MGINQSFQNHFEDIAAHQRLDLNVKTSRAIQSGLAFLSEFDLSEEDRNVLEIALWIALIKSDETESSGSLSADLIKSVDTLGKGVITKIEALLAGSTQDLAKYSQLEQIFNDALNASLADPKYLKKRINNFDHLNNSTLPHVLERELIKKLETHRYITPQGQAILEPLKMKNIDYLRKKLKIVEKEVDYKLMQDLNVDGGELKILKKKMLKAEGSPERGIETWFRTASRNLYTRRQIVDTKSNIMITMNAIIMSLMLGTLYSQLKDNPHVLWFLIPMVLTNVMSMSFAIFATRPVLENGIFTREEVIKKEARLTTFDDFYQMPLKEYEWAVGEMLQDRQFLYNTLIRDMHRLGVDLAIRYKNIRLSYHVFLTGLIFSIFMFAACYVIL